MRRVAAKGMAAGAASAGEGARTTQVWQRISWDEALDEIASRFRGVISKFGSEAILPYSYGGTLGALNGGSMDRRFFQSPRRFGTGAHDLFFGGRGWA